MGDVGHKSLGVIPFFGQRLCLCFQFIAQLIKRIGEGLAENERKGFRCIKAGIIFRQIAVEQSVKQLLLLFLAAGKAGKEKGDKGKITAKNQGKNRGESFE